MKREIKFRGLNISGEWCVGNLSIVNTDLNGQVERGVYISNSIGTPFAYSVRPETVGQFTGLYDKNGKEIYEGDILKAVSKGKEYVGEVYYDEAQWFGATDYLYYAVTNSNAEVIGNIYENPYLLK